MITVSGSPAVYVQVHACIVQQSMCMRGEEGDKRHNDDSTSGRRRMMLIQETATVRLKDRIIAQIRLFITRVRRIRIPILR